MKPNRCVRAIADDPTDLRRRLDLADWAQGRGEPERAELIRLLCDYGEQMKPLRQQLPFYYARPDRHPPWFGLTPRTFKQVTKRLLAKCAPDYWANVPGIRQELFFGRRLFLVMCGPGRALDDFDFSSATRRLGQVKWLVDAYEDGWLEAIDLPLWDADQARAVIDWPAAARSHPILISTEQTSPEGFNSRLMREVLSLPGLRGMQMASGELALGCMKDFARLAAGLQYLHLFRVTDTKATRQLMQQLPDLRQLRLLEIIGGVPNDEHLRLIARMPQLTSLSIFCDNFTDQGLRQLARSPSLVSLMIDSTQITRRAVYALRDANPRIRVTVAGDLREQIGPA